VARCGGWPHSEHDQECNPGYLVSAHSGTLVLVDHLRTGLVLGERYRLVAPVRAARPDGAWRAVDQATNLEVAMKAIGTLPASALTSPARLQLLLRIATELPYPGIARVHDCGHLAVPGYGSVPFLVRELVRGPTLEDRLADGSLRVGEALNIVASVADALAAAHRAGMVHGNLVPANVVLGPGGVKITDFALWLVRDRTPGGGPASVLSYAAPELASGGPATPATDMYSLGVVFVACMSGIAAGGTVGAAPVAGLASESAASGLASLWAACLGASPLDRPSAARAAVISRQMATAGPSSLTDLGSGTSDPPPGGQRELTEPPRLEAPGPEAPPLPGRRGGGGSTGHRERRRLRLGLSRPDATRPAGRRRPATAPGGVRSSAVPPGACSRAVAQAGRRWSGLVALGGAATGVTVAVLVVLSQFVASPATRTASQGTVSTAHARPRVTATHTHHPTGAGSSPDARSSSPEATSSARASAAASASVPASSPRQVIDQIWQTIRNGVNAGQIRPDVGVDFDNLIAPVRTQLALGKQVAVAPLVTTLRDKLQTRAGEGAVSAGVARVLSAEFTDLLHSAG
jgi:eukaryotic-like serine/threonine-protein kinase